jgi:hypothetical protein
MDERSYRRRARFSRLVEDLAGLVERLGEVARECLEQRVRVADRS